MLKDLVRIQEHRKYLRSDEKERDRGIEGACLHFRNCRDGCAAFNFQKEMELIRPGGDPALLKQACDDCDLEAAPYSGAEAVMEMALLPIDSMAGDLPWSIVQGIQFLAEKRRSF